MSPTTEHEEPCPITRPYPRPYPELLRSVATRTAPMRRPHDSSTHVMAAPPAALTTPAPAFGPLPPPCPPPRRGR